MGWVERAQSRPGDPGLSPSSAPAQSAVLGKSLLTGLVSPAANGTMRASCEGERKGCQWSTVHRTTQGIQGIATLFSSLDFNV